MIAVIYGSSTLNTEYSAQRIQSAFGDGIADLHNVKHLEIELVRERDCLVFISSTWGTGDLQDDWELFFPAWMRSTFTVKQLASLGSVTKKTTRTRFATVFLSCTTRW